MTVNMELSFYFGVFSETRIRTLAYLMVPGRRQACLISELPRRVLLGNSEIKGLHLDKAVSLELSD